MNITFTPLAKSHLSLMFRWLQKPHVKTFWDKSVNRTLDLIEKNIAQPYIL